MPFSAPAASGSFTPPDVLQAVLDVSLTAVHLLRPLYGPAGATIVDFSLDYLNPAGQRLTGLPEQPGGTVRSHFPPAVAEDLLAYYQRTYQTGEKTTYCARYQAQGLDTHFQYAARRQGEWLVVSFTEAADQPRSTDGQTLRESQAQEREARAQAEAQRQRFYEILMQLPANVAVYYGPEHVITLVNEPYRRLFAPRTLPGEPARTALPELAGQGLADLLDQVYRTGEPVAGIELAVRWPHAGPHEHPNRYYETLLQPLRDAQGRVTGVLDCSVDVTEQVLARQRVEQLNEELEARVQERTRQLEEQQHIMRQTLEQVPASVALLSGPEHRLLFANAQYQQLVAFRAQLGQPLGQALPEVVEQGLLAGLDQVYASGQPFVGTEVAVLLAQPSGPPTQRYLNLAHQPVVNSLGEIESILAFAVDVTEQVLARQRVEQLNQELEARVQERTQQLGAQQQLMQQVLRQVPAGIATLHGPEHRFSFFNQGYQQLVGGRALLGEPMTERVSELVTEGYRQLLDQVFATGQPYVGTDAALHLYDPQTGQARLRYFDFTYQPLLDAQGRPEGVLLFTVEVTERQQARQQVEHERKRLQAIFAQAPVAIALFEGEQQVVVLVNDDMGAVWGHPPAAVLNRPLLEGVPELRGQGFDNLLAEVARTSVPFVGTEVAAELRQPDGSVRTRYFNFVYQPLLGADDEVMGVLDIALDVTEQVLARLEVEQLNQELEARVQKRTQQLETARAAVERQRQQWEAVFRRAPAAICIFSGPEWVYEFVNSDYQALFPDRQLLGRRLLEALPELVGSPTLAIIRQVYDTGISYTGHETPILLPRPGGRPAERRYFNLTFQVRHNDADQIDGFVTYAYDVTEQVLARQQREEQRQLLQQVFEQAPVGVYVMRMPNYVLDVVNPPMAQVLGRPIDELRGRPFFEAVPEVASQGLPALLDQVWRTQQPLYMHEQPFHLVYHQPGELGYFSYVYQPVLDPQGQMTAMVCIVLDVTTQVEARRQVQALNEELTATNAELLATNHQLTRTNVDLDTFVYTASHDLKAPITNIEGIVLALRELLPTEVQQQEMIAHLLDLLNHTVGRFLTTISQLTDLSRLQRAHSEPAELVELAPMVEAVRLDLEPPIAAAQAQLHVAVPAGLRVSFSPSNLRSILYNLLSNAVKYRAPNRPAQVWLRAEQQPTAVVLTVQDNGLGLSSSQQQRLFGLFQRLHTHVEGTGVGLYMIKRLIENGGGQIFVQSAPDLGSTFTVVFPA